MMFKAAVGAFVVFVLASTVITRNITDSLETGWFIRSFEPPAASPYVMFPMPENMRAFFTKRGDIEFFDHPRHGFIKRVRAVAGDEVCGVGGSLYINRVSVGSLRNDIPYGELLPRFTECRRLRTNEILPMGDHPGSIDGRYFGPISTDVATGYRELFRY